MQIIPLYKYKTSRPPSPPIDIIAAKALTSQNAGKPLHSCVQRQSPAQANTAWQRIASASRGFLPRRRCQWNGRLFRTYQFANRHSGIHQNEVRRRQKHICIEREFLRQKYRRILGTVRLRWLSALDNPIKTIVLVKYIVSFFSLGVFLAWLNQCLIFVFSGIFSEFPRKSPLTHRQQLSVTVACILQLFFNYSSVYMGNRSRKTLRVEKCRRRKMHSNFISPHTAHSNQWKTPFSAFIYKRAKSSSSFTFS